MERGTKIKTILSLYKEGKTKNENASNFEKKLKSFFLSLDLSKVKNVDFVINNIYNGEETLEPPREQLKFFVYLY